MTRRPLHVAGVSLRVLGPQAAKANASGHGCERMNLYALAYVPDPAASVAFYAQAFGLKARFVADGNTYAELDTPGVKMGFVADKQAQGNLPEGYRRNTVGGPPAGFEFGFEVEDVEAAWQRALDAGAIACAEPADKPWGQRIAYVRDRDGILVELAQRLE